MTVGILTTSFPRFEGDLAGPFVRDFASALVARGHAVEVLAPEPAPPAPPRPAGDRIAVRQVTYLRPRTLQRTFYGAGVPDNLRLDPRAWLGLPAFPLALLRAAREAAPRWDALVSHWALPSALVAGAVRGDRPHLAVLHGSDVHLLERLPGRRALAARIARTATTLQFVSADLRTRFLALLPRHVAPEAQRRSVVLPMGIAPPPTPPSDRSALRASLGLRTFTALFVGRLVPIKGVDVALHAVASLGAGATLVIAGDGPERARLEALARRLGTPVRFLGPVHGPHKHAWLAAADAFVAPSTRHGGRTEGAPTAVLEAMAAGLPVVTTGCGGLRELIRHRHDGLRVPEGDPAALARALATLRAHPDEAAALGAAARHTAAAHTWPTLMERVEPWLGLSCARPACPAGA
jgi:glycosyltransferase involved in cell wall biosynthesis